MCDPIHGEHRSNGGRHAEAIISFVPISALAGRLVGLDHAPVRRGFSGRGFDPAVVVRGHTVKCPHLLALAAFGR